jgi:hypothetical protein
MPTTTWRKSSSSSEPDGNCVEVAWRKSSASSSSDGNCVEVAFAQVGVAVRDSKNAGGPMLTVSPASWLRLTKLTRA